MFCCSFVISRHDMFRSHGFRPVVVLATIAALHFAPCVGNGPSNGHVGGSDRTPMETLGYRVLCFEATEPNGNVGVVQFCVLLLSVISSQARVVLAKSVFVAFHAETLQPDL